MGVVSQRAMEEWGRSNFRGKQWRRQKLCAMETTHPTQPSFEHARSVHNSRHWNEVEEMPKRERERGRGCAGRGGLEGGVPYVNCATVRSPGTRYFFLSISLMSAFRAFSTITGIRSSYLQSGRLSVAAKSSYDLTDVREK